MLSRNILCGLLLALTFSAFSSAATNVSTCQTISSAGDYVVNATLSINGATCITISASNVSVSCEGRNITGNLTAGTIGIRTAGDGQARTNVTVSNCVVNFFESGISLDRITSANVSYNTVSNQSSAGSSGISLTSSNASVVQSNTVYNITTPNMNIIATG